MNLFDKLNNKQIEMFADIFPRGEETAAVSVEVGSEFSDLAGLSGELLRLAVKVQSLISVPGFHLKIHV